MFVRPLVRSVVSPLVRSVTTRGRGRLKSLDEQTAAFVASLTVPRLWLDVSDSATRYQDVAGTSLITSSGQSFARLNDKGGGANHVGQSVTPSMPLYQTDGTLHWARADGADDSWYSLANLDLSSTNKVTVIAGLRKRSDAATARFLELGPSTTTLDGTFSIRAPQGAAATFSVAGRGSATPSGTDSGFQTSPANFPAPISAVVTLIHDLSAATLADQMKLVVNGVAVGVSGIGGTNAGGGNFASAVLNLFRRNNSLFPAAVDFYGLMIIGRLLTAAELALCHQFMASKSGVTL